MSPKNTRQMLLNIAIVLLVAVIIAAAYVLITNPDESIDILSPEEVIESIESTDEYIDKDIIVEGYYYHGNYRAGEGYITSSITEPLSSSAGFLQRLSVNHSNVNMSLADQVKYRFTGLLTLDEAVLIPFGKAVILIASEIIRV